MRRFKPRQKKVNPDPVYKNEMVTKLIGRAMKDGKKTVIQKEVYKAFEIVKEKTNEEPMAIFERALENIRPTMEVRPRRIGGAAYQVPVSVRGPRRDSLAIRWLVQNSRLLSNSEFHTYAEKLASEIINAANGEGSTVKKKTDVEKMAEANRAFAHFRW